MDKTMETINMNGSELKINDRKKLNLTGLKKLVSFNPEEFVIESNLGTLIIKGEMLDIVKLDILDGNLNLKGKINAISYYDEKGKHKEDSFMAKLFK